MKIWNNSDTPDAMREIFSKVEIKPGKRARIQDLPDPERAYCIVFTARSGSSRLTDVLDGTGVLSKPGELFNPSFLPNFAQAYQAQNMDDYVAFSARRRATSGVFGFEVTMPQMRFAFGSADHFMQRYEGVQFFQLIREDIVAQAVSLTKKIKTKVGHSVSADSATTTALEAQFEYDDDEFKKRIKQFATQEEQAVEMFAAHKITPIRISYEQLARTSPAQIAQTFANVLGCTETISETLTSQHIKISGSRSAEHIARFKTENGSFLNAIAKRRALLLAQLNGDLFDTPFEQACSK